MHIKIYFVWLTVIIFTLPTAIKGEVIKITDDRGVQSFSVAPQRAVVLNWDLLEQILELDVVPVGTANISGYQEWVVQPNIPASVEDIGTRAEPNLEKIAQLQPDIIIAASPQKDLLEVLGQIAPVVYLPNYSQEDQAAEQAIRHFRTLAKLFGKEDLAERKLREMEDRFKELKQQLSKAFVRPPEVVAMRFSNTTSVFIYTENSTAQYVLEQLGLVTAMPQPAKAWGIVQKRLKDLQHVKEGYVLYVLPFPDEAKLQKSVLWRAMPFVRGKRVNSVPSVWNYGGAMSLRYLAEAFTQSLLELVPAK